MKTIKAIALAAASLVAAASAQSGGSGDPPDCAEGCTYHPENSKYEILTVGLDTFEDEVEINVVPGSVNYGNGSCKPVEAVIYQGDDIVSYAWLCKTKTACYGAADFNVNMTEWADQAGFELKLRSLTKLPNGRTIVGSASQHSGTDVVQVNLDAAVNCGGTMTSIMEIDLVNPLDNHVWLRSEVNLTVECSGCVQPGAD